MKVGFDVITINQSTILELSWFFVCLGGFNKFLRQTSSWKIFTTGFTMKSLTGCKTMISLLNRF